MLVASGVAAGAAVAVAGGASVGASGIAAGPLVAVSGVAAGVEVAAGPWVAVLVVGSGTVAEVAVGNAVMVDVACIAGAEVAEELQAAANNTSIPARPTNSLSLLPPTKIGFIHFLALTESPASATGNPAVILVMTSCGLYVGPILIARSILSVVL